MSTPTNIPKTPMGGTEQDSYPNSKEKFQQQLQDIFQTALKLTGPGPFDQLCQWRSTTSTSPLMTSITVLTMTQENLTLNTNGKGR